MWKMLNGCLCTGKCAEVAPLVLRVALGAIFAWHGYDKVFVKGMPAISGFLGSLGFPMSDVFAYILGYGELATGLLVILGLFTRLAAKYQVIVAVVAFLTVHASKGFAISGGGYEFIMLIGAAALAIAIMGPGKFSLDAMWLGKKEGEAGM